MIKLLSGGQTRKLFSRLEDMAISLAKKPRVAGRLSRGFARAIKKVEKTFDLEKIKISDQSIIYTKELNEDRDFFYQEMLNFKEEQEAIDFYESRKDQFDGLGVKLLIIRLFENRNNGTLPKRKLARLMYGSGLQEHYSYISELFNYNSQDKLSKLPSSQLQELVEMVSLHSIRSQPFEDLMIKRFMYEDALVSNQYIYDVLLNTYKENTPPFFTILDRLEWDLANRRFEITDIRVGLVLLDKALSSGERGNRLIRLIELFLKNSLKSSIGRFECLHLFRIYSDNKFKSPDLDLLDMAGHFLSKQLNKLYLTEIQDLLKHCANIRYEDFNLLSSINRHLFDDLSKRLTEADSALLALDSDNQVSESQEAIDYQDQPEDNSSPEKVDPDDEADYRFYRSNYTKEERDELEAITRSIFGNPLSYNERLAISEEQLANGGNHQPMAILSLPEELTKLPETLYHMIKLNVG